MKCFVLLCYVGEGPVPTALVISYFRSLQLYFSGLLIILHNLYCDYSTILYIYNNNNKKTFPVILKDVGMSKPKKHSNKVRWDENLNRPLPYNPT